MNRRIVFSYGASSVIRAKFSKFTSCRDAFNTLTRALHATAVISLKPVRYQSSESQSLSPGQVSDRFGYYAPLNYLPIRKGTTLKPNHKMCLSNILGTPMRSKTAFSMVWEVAILMEWHILLCLFIDKWIVKTAQRSRHETLSNKLYFLYNSFLKSKSLPTRTAFNQPPRFIKPNKCRWTLNTINNHFITNYFLRIVKTITG